MSERSLRPLIMVVLALAGCAAEPMHASVVLPADFDDAPPLADGTVRDGAPANGELPEEGKADATYPARFDLLALQSPVRNQARRGVCSIFATIGLMESLYIAEGTMAAPDFSEQFLQWSAKNEARGFMDTDGSNASVNLDAINRFGIPEESAWPYEQDAWSTTNDAACTGEMRPTRCYTNGEPPEAARAATRWHLPRGRWINSRVRSLKGHMTETNTPVVVGLDFFYQAWNHRGSKLVTSREHFARGWVTSPSAEDVTDSRMRRAGHAIVLVGWDDELEVPLLDATGQPRVDAMGAPVTERGFFLFKNSWGTGSFGTMNPKGAGYGWISYAYVEAYGSAYASALPEIAPARAETCGNGSDDDADGATDCADADCATHASCAMPATTTTTHTSDRAMPIPDDDTTGIASEISVTEGGAVTSVTVDVAITHPYRGDLVVALRKDETHVVLFERDGGAADDLVRTFTVEGFTGSDAAGTWTLAVTDTAAADVGTLTSWTLRIAR